MPAYVAINPIRVSKYLYWPIIFMILFYLILFQVIIMNNPNEARIEPWPMSPNMTPKKNGNVAIVTEAGFASLYYGIPYVSTINWKLAVASFVLIYVGL
jgi:hypothetical protein